MRLNFMTPVVLWIAATAFASSGFAFNDPKTDPKPPEAKSKIRFPEPAVKPEPAPAPKPEPAPAPNASVSLGAGQFYVIASPVPLLVLPNADLKLNGAGDVTVSHRKPPLTVPAEIAVGYVPDPSDPDAVTFNEPFLYIVKAKTAGPVVLQIIPAASGADKPLSRESIVYRPIRVGGAVPGPAPEPKPPEPDAAPDASLVKAFKDALQADSDAMGTPIEKATVAGLASVYSDALTALSLGDPAIRPKTWKDLQQQMVKDSRAANVPVPPALSNLRKAIDAEANVGLSPNQSLDAATTLKLKKPFTRIAAALNELAK